MAAERGGLFTSLRPPWHAIMAAPLSARVKQAFHERKHGGLKSGGSQKVVTSRKQATAFGLPEPRRDGKKGPKKTGAPSNTQG